MAAHHIIVTTQVMKAVPVTSPPFAGVVLDFQLCAALAAAQTRGGTMVSYGIFV
jgi:hypothetical protein